MKIPIRLLNTEKESGPVSSSRIFSGAASRANRRSSRSEQGAFDKVPIDQMRNAEMSLRQATTNIQPETLDRLKKSEKLSEEDVESILKIAQVALEPFLSKEPAKTTNPDKS